MILAVDIAALRAPASFGLLLILLAWETAQPFFGFFPSHPHRVRKRLLHGLLNIGIGLLNGLAIRYVFLWIWLMAMNWSEASGFGIIRWLSMPDWQGWILTVLVLDAWTYAWHRMNHTVAFFWRFHHLHHSDREMDVTTSNRFHLGEIALSSLFRIPLLMLIGCRIEQLALYELMLFAVVQFHHANIAIPEWLDRALRLVIVTPHLHKVHHSVVRAEQNANFSSLFSWWDRLARTLRLSDCPQRIVFGVDPAEPFQDAPGGEKRSV